MKIEAGKYYKTRDGQKVGPLAVKDSYFEAAGWHYNENGICCYKGFSKNLPHPERDLIAEWADTPDDGWSEWTSASEWDTGKHDVQFECIDGIHRVRTRPRKPTVETVTLAGRIDDGGDWSFGTGEAWPNDTHRITFNLIDGKPDPSSIRMEEL